MKSPNVVFVAGQPVRVHNAPGYEDFDAYVWDGVEHVGMLLVLDKATVPFVIHASHVFPREKS